jgi:hypothetical protein
MKRGTTSRQPTAQSCPPLRKAKKAKLLDYELNNSGMPLTNPVDAYDEIEAAFLRSGYAS